MVFVRQIPVPLCDSQDESQDESNAQVPEEHKTLAFLCMKIYTHFKDDENEKFQKRTQELLFNIYRVCKQEYLAKDQLSVITKYIESLNKKVLISICPAASTSDIFIGTKKRNSKETELFACVYLFSRIYMNKYHWYHSLLCMVTIEETTVSEVSYFLIKQAHVSCRFGFNCSRTLLDARETKMGSSLVSNIFLLKETHVYPL